MAKIEFGIVDSFSYSFMTSAPNIADTYERLICGVQRLEQLGFGYYFVTEHQSEDIAMCTTPAVYLTAIAQRTSSIRLGAMIFQLPFHNPLRLAQDMAMVDQLSRGRVDFGVGAGVREHEFLRWKMSFDERRDMSAEAMEIIMKAWSEENFTYDGKYWQFEEALPWPKPYQKPHPPVWMAAASPSTIELAAKMNYNIAQSLEPDEVAAEKNKRWRTLWKEAGHDGPTPRSTLDRTIYVADTDEQARKEAEPHLVTQVAQMFLNPGERVARTKIGFVRGSGNAAAHSEERIRTYKNMASGIDFWLETGLAHVGSAETVARRIEAQQKLIGYQVLCSHFRFGDLTNEQVDKSIRLFGEKVIPTFS